MQEKVTTLHELPELSLLTFFHMLLINKIIKLKKKNIKSHQIWDSFLRQECDFEVDTCLNYKAFQVLPIKTSYQPRSFKRLTKTSYVRNEPRVIKNTFEMHYYSFYFSIITYIRFQIFFLQNISVNSTH